MHHSLVGILTYLDTNILTIPTSTYPNNTGWVGTHMVNAAFRGQGFGYPLTRAIFSTLKSQFDPSADNFFVGVDSTPKQLEPNKTQGFVDRARIHLMTRKSLAEASLNVTWSSEEAVELHDLRDVDSALVTQLDLAHTGLNRKAHWDQLVSPDHAPGYAIMSEDGTLTGFIYARRCPDGRRIGPLYAATYANARQLLHKMMNDFARSKSGNMVAEIFGTNKEGQKVFEELGWAATEEMYHRMWLFGKVPVEQQEGGMGAKGMYAIYDACTG
jgi:hypothetical protein